MAKRIAFTVHGKVQGVFYRAFAEDKASQYGLTGWVKNASDGSVQGEAQGDESALQKFTEDLKEGSSASRVSNVGTKDIEVKSGERKFTTS